MSRESFKSEKMDLQVNKSNFNFYKLNTLPSEIKKTTFWQEFFSPSNHFRLKMYFYFFLGTIALLFLSWVALYKLQDYGSQTYWIYLRGYWQNNQNKAIFNLGIMVLINLFWILIDLILNYLAVSQDWIDNYKRSWQTEEKFLELKNNQNSDFWQVFTDQEGNQEKEEEDIAEFESLLAHPFFSILAPFWQKIKTFYRFSENFLNFLYNFFRNFPFYLKQVLLYIKTLWLDFWELIIYIFNPFNFLEEFLDVLILLLVRFLYPAILTPIIFFIPIRYNYLFGSWTNFIIEIILYFLIIGCLRLGMTFFTIYLRFLKNNIKTYN